MADKKPNPKNKKPGSYWALVPVGLLLFLMSIVGTMVFISARDPNFAVEPDYYDKAVAWDEHRAQLSANQRLGWKAEWSITPAGDRTAELSVSLVDVDGAALRGALVSVHAFHNAYASQVQKLELRESAPGSYEAPLRFPRPGLWEFRLRVAHHGQVFTQVHRTELVRPARAQHVHVTNAPAAGSVN